MKAKKSKIQNELRKQKHNGKGFENKARRSQTAIKQCFDADDSRLEHDLYTKPPFSCIHPFHALKYRWEPQPPYLYNTITLCSIINSKSLNLLSPVESERLQMTGRER